MKLKPLSFALLTLMVLAVLDSHGLSSAQEEEPHQVWLAMRCGRIMRAENSLVSLVQLSTPASYGGASCALCAVRFSQRLN